MSDRALTVVWALRWCGADIDHHLSVFCGAVTNLLEEMDWPVGEARKVLAGALSDLGFAELDLIAHEDLSELIAECSGKVFQNKMHQLRRFARKKLNLPIG